jgi:citrate synthase
MAFSAQAQGKLFVRDSRTSRDYEILISNNTINASDFQKIQLSSNGRSMTKASGPLLYDPGMENTAVKKTEIIGRFVLPPVSRWSTN